MIAHPYETGNQIRPKGLRLIGHVLARGNSLTQDEANARLIAAAPDLLAALELFANASMSGWNGGGESHIGWQRGEGLSAIERVQQARTAIAKARGQS